MKLPERIKIAHLNFTVLVLETNSYDDNGGCNFETQTIKLSKKLKGNRLKEILLHEIFHALYYLWALKEGDDEERVVDAFAVGLATVLRDNPAVADFLNERP